MNISSKRVAVFLFAVLIQISMGRHFISAQTVSNQSIPSGTHWPGMQYAGSSEPSWQRAVSGHTTALPQHRPSQFQALAQQPQVQAPLPPQTTVGVGNMTTVAGIPYVAVDNSSHATKSAGNAASQISAQNTHVAAPAIHPFHPGMTANRPFPVSQPAVHTPPNAQQIVAVSGREFAPFPSTQTPQAQPSQAPGDFHFHNNPLRIPDEPSQVRDAIPDFVVPAEGYAIAELQQMALQNNPVLFKKRREIEATYGTWLQVGLYANPTIGFVGDDYADNGTQGKQGISIQQEIIRGDKLGIARNVEKWSIEIANKEWEIAQVKVANDVKALAYDYMVALYLVEANRALVKIAEDCVSFSESLVKIHELGKNDLLQNRILRNRAMVELSKAEQDEREKWVQLVAMVGRPDLTKRGITDVIGHALFDVEPEQIFRDLTVESPEIQLEQLRRQKAQCVIAQEKSKAVSDITIGGAVSYNVSQKAMVGDVTVNMPLRVYDRNQGNIRRAQADAMAQACEIERVQLALRTRFSLEWNNYMKAHMVMRHYETSILPDAKESINLALQGAKQGELTSLELLITQQTYIQSLIEYIAAVRDAAVSSTYINGMLLKGGLDAD